MSAPRPARTTGRRAARRSARRAQDALLRQVLGQKRDLRGTDGACKACGQQLCDCSDKRWIGG